MKQNSFLLHYRTPLSAACFVFFALLAVGSAKVNKLHCDAFRYNFPDEADSISSYVVLKDGTKVHGGNISWQNGLLKSTINVGGKKIEISDTRGCFYGGRYYGRVGTTGYARRIIHGKLNIYFTRSAYTEKTRNNYNSFETTTTRWMCLHYIQAGEEGELVLIGGQKDLRKYVADCPAAANLIDKSNKEIRNEIKENPGYLNNVINIYNNGCKE